MKTLRMYGASALLAVLCLSACSESGNDYPKEYIGFDKATESYSFDKTTEEQDINIKIIAADKKDNDREVTLSGKWKPGEVAAFKIMDAKVVIPAKKKSTTARIRIYPKLIKCSTEARIICSPKDKEVKQTQLTLKLVVK